VTSIKIYTFNALKRGKFTQNVPIPRSYHSTPPIPPFKFPVPRSPPRLLRSSRALVKSTAVMNVDRAVALCHPETCPTIKKPKMTVIR
jgi:hypothetical protein